MAKEFIVYSPSRATFEALVASGEVDYTQIGIIAESGEFWENGNYHPLVMLSDYLKKTDAVALAKDLTGSIEATPEEFIFRPSAGTKSIRDESAVIRRIKGNTSVWGQIADINASFTNSGNRYIITRNDDGSVTIKRDPTITEGYWCAYNMNQAYRHTSHKYMFYADVSVSGVAASTDYCGVSVYNLATMVGNHPNFRSNGRHAFCCFGVPNDTSTSWQFAFYAYGVAELTIHNLQCFDLTQIFGAGNEPTTIEEFKKTYPESYYPYCVPEVRSMRATGIETIGANAFDKDSVVGGLIKADGTVTSNDIYSVAKIEVVPYEKYTLTNVANAANTTYTYALYDSEDRFISVGEIKNSVTKPVSVSGDVTMPLNARYMRVVVHNDYLDSCCVNLKHSGTLTAEDATYFKEVRMLPDIAKYFPGGMHGIGGVYDEINEENVVTRFGVVDLGTLTWASNGTSSSTGGLRCWTTSSIKSVFPTGTNNYEKSPNMVCLKYPTGSINSTYRGELSIACGTGGDIFLFDPEYTSNDDKAAFVASLQGVLLYYELAEPIVTPVTEPLQWDYKVADFGTEKMLSDLPSSPFRADIVYQFNAADRIRDNARNIERLEEHTKDMATMEDVINAIPTEVATATQRNVVVSGTSFLFLPNILYEYEQSVGEYTIPELVGGNSSYDNVWMLRVSVASSSTLTIPFDVVWENSQAPSFASGAIIELRFRKLTDGRIIGDWKIYR